MRRVRRAGEDRGETVTGMKATGQVVPDEFCPLILALFGISHLADLLDLRYAYDLMAGVGFTGGLGLTLTLF